MREKEGTPVAIIGMTTASNPHDPAVADAANRTQSPYVTTVTDR